MPKLFNKTIKDHLKDKRTRNTTKNFKEVPAMSMDDLLLSLEKFYTNELYENEDEKFLLQNFICLISKGKLRIGSLAMKHISSIIRQTDASMPSQISKVEEEYINSFTSRYKLSNHTEEESKKILSEFLLLSDRSNESMCNKDNNCVVSRTASLSVYGNVQSMSLSNNLNANEVYSNENQSHFNQMHNNLRACQNVFDLQSATYRKVSTLLNVLSVMNRYGNVMEQNHSVDIAEHMQKLFSNTNL